MKLFDPTGQTELITGASMGIGFAQVHGLAESRSKVVTDLEHNRHNCDFTRNADEVS